VKMQSQKQHVHFPPDILETIKGKNTRLIWCRLMWFPPPPQHVPAVKWLKDSARDGKGEGGNHCRLSQLTAGRGW
jgi:hypothetical protein